MASRNREIGKFLNIMTASILFLFFAFSYKANAMGEKSPATPDDKIITAEEMQQRFPEPRDGNTIDVRRVGIGNNSTLDRSSGGGIGRNPTPEPTRKKNQN